MGREELIIGLNELELTNNDIFVRKAVSNLKSNTKIVVYETHNAILLRNGILQETLEAGEYPLFEIKHGIFKDHKLGASTVEVIYVSKTVEAVVKWGTPQQFLFRDPVTQVVVKMGACGEIGVKVDNPRKMYCELIGAQAKFSIEDLKERLRNRLLNEVEPLISQVMREKQITYAEFNEHKKEVESSVLKIIQKMFSDNYGLKVTYFVINNVIVDENDREELENELKKIRKDDYNEKKKAVDREDFLWWSNENEKLKDRQAERQKILNQIDKTEKVEEENYVDEDESGDSLNICFNCGTLNDKDAKFCTQCGKTLNLNEKICHNCGEVNDGKNKFCFNCGEKL